MIKVEPTASTETKPRQIIGGIEILFEDPHLIVLVKPAGLLSQSDHSEEPSLVTHLRTYLKRNYVGLIHRLDRNTSGIMIVAKRTKSAQRLSQSLLEGKLKRSYLSWLLGELKGAVHWSHALLKDERTNTVRVVSPQSQKGKSAKLFAEPLKVALWRNQKFTLAEITLETGRSHQIRVQAAYEGHPVLGDRKYGQALGFPRTALHSYRLEFPHPMSGETLSFTAELPADLNL
ncbi:MAG: RluA family pseudouridine synthase [Bdellovibrio sp.]|nr:RluA family pseudouridine synthase [Bdellovibrio sp.]